MPFVLSSPAFADQGEIPRVHTGLGADLSPPLRWAGAPAETRAFALLVLDPDAPGGPFTHWTLWDLPADLTGLEGGQLRAHHLPGGARQGSNSFGRVGWGGPLPPAGPPHRYRFTLSALRRPLGVPAGAPPVAFTSALLGRVLVSTSLEGRFGRPG